MRSTDGGSCRTEDLSLLFLHGKMNTSLLKASSSVGVCVASLATPSQSSMLTPFIRNLPMSEWTWTHSLELFSISLSSPVPYLLLFLLFLHFFPPSIPSFPSSSPFFSDFTQYCGFKYHQETHWDGRAWTSFSLRHTYLTFYSTASWNYVKAALLILPHSKCVISEVFSILLMLPLSCPSQEPGCQS